MQNEKLKRISIAEDTLKTIEKGVFTTPSGQEIDFFAAQMAAQNGTKCYSPTDLDEILAQRKPTTDYPTTIEVTGETSLDAVRRLVDAGKNDVMCLNFASAKNAGGGFLGGSQAQEESIARASGLYPCLLKAPDYYSTHRGMSSCLYTDTMIYSPNVPIFKIENGTYSEKLYTATIITSAAVNAGVVRSKSAKETALIEPIMRVRIAKVLALAEKYGHTTLVLGAWGCGVFMNDPEKIAAYFKQSIETDFKNSFKHITFAVYSKNPKFITPFQQNFG